MLHGEQTRGTDAERHEFSLNLLQKLCERPQNHTLGPYASKQIKANVKVSSTETGVIFGNIVYEIAGAAATAGADRSCVILNDIHIDIMDYITPGYVDDVAFRSMCVLFLATLLPHFLPPPRHNCPCVLLG